MRCVFGVWGFGEPSQQFALEDIGSPEQLLTLYQLMAQLTMDGTRNTTLNYHIVTRKTPEPGTRGVERYTVDNPRSKFWQTTKKRDHPSSDASCHNIGRYLHSSAEQLIPNAVSKATSQHLSKKFEQHCTIINALPCTVASEFEFNVWFLICCTSGFSMVAGRVVSRARAFRRGHHFANQIPRHHLGQGDDRRGRASHSMGLRLVSDSLVAPV